MRLLVNAVGLRAGGGLTVGLNCLRGLCESRPDYEVMALVPEGCGYEQLCASLSIPFEAFATGPLYLAWRFWFDQVQVPRRARQWGAEVLFTMNNQGAWASPCPQLLLFHNPYYIYPVADWWRNQVPFDGVSFLVQRLLFAAVVRRCACVAAQTPVAARRLREQFGIEPTRLVVVPSAIAAEHLGGESEAGRLLALRMQAAAAGRVSVLTLARYYPHKGLEFVLQVAQRLRELGDRRFVFFITVAAEQHPGARALLDSIEREGLQERVVNLGPLAFEALGSAYGAAQVCFLPTVLESMSGSHLEALHYQLPIVTADRDFARDACGSAAHYFAPGNVDAAIAQLRAISALPAPSRARAPLPAPQPRGWGDVSADFSRIIDSIRHPDTAVAGRTAAISSRAHAR
jgi:glycosyltransferase involved in cell wall biosynthesis